ncbi:hypothetical protein HY572_04080 [Candidatus Micrarchaeota archaeon]|nr:hypothetical protein [Candidatus Micrarchaeota archaeon]
MKETLQRAFAETGLESPGAQKKLGLKSDQLRLGGLPMQVNEEFLRQLRGNVYGERELEEVVVDTGLGRVKIVDRRTLEKVLTAANGSIAPARSHGPKTAGIYVGTHSDHPIDVGLKVLQELGIRPGITAEERDALEQFKRNMRGIMSGVVPPTGSTARKMIKNDLGQIAEIQERLRKEIEGDEFEK